MTQQTHAVWQKPRSRTWIRSIFKYCIGSFVLAALLAAVSIVLYQVGNEAYKGVALTAIVLSIMAICLGPFMRYHLEDVSVMPRVLELYKGRVGSHPVKIKLTINGVEIGRDYGVVEFDGANLNYTGLRTSFNFARSSASVVNWSSIPNDTELLFSQTEGEDLVLAISSISRVDPDNYYSLSPAFRKALKTWLLSETASVGSEVLPPNRLRFKSDFRSNADHYGWLGSIYLVYMITRWLASREVPYNILAFIFPLAVVLLIAAYVVRTGRKNAEFIRKYWANSASLSQ